MSRFSQLYLQKKELSKDSDRFRNRLASYFSQHLSQHYNQLVKQLYELETGSTVPWRGSYQLVHDIFTLAALRDVLDLITIVHRILIQRNANASADDWHQFVMRTMKEEGMGFRIDDECIVHYYVDEEFEVNRIASLRILESQKFLAVRQAFEDAFKYMDSDPPDTKASVRSIFESLEILARLIIPETKNLSRSLVKNQLKNACLQVTHVNKIEKDVIAGMLDGFSEWVEVMHNYRHGQPDSDPISPSEDLTIHILSTGSAYLRQIAMYADKII